VVSLFKSLINFIIGIFIMIYVMAIKTQLVGQSKKIIYAIFPVKKANDIIETIRKSNEIFGGFIIGRIIDSAIIGLICYIGCLILRIPSAFLVAIVVGVTNIIQFFGPITGALITIPLVLIQSPIHGLYLAIFILILQQVDGNIIGPKILGDTIGVSSFWIMFSILIAGGLFGFFGMLLGVPIFAIIYYITQKVVKGRMTRKKLPTTTEEYVELQSIDEKTLKPVYETTEEEN
jgi:predicted PurR-regulated permease PerM